MDKTNEETLKLNEQLKHIEHKKAVENYIKDKLILTGLAIIMYYTLNQMIRYMMPVYIVLMTSMILVDSIKEYKNIKKKYGSFKYNKTDLKKEEVLEKIRVLNHEKEENRKMIKEKNREINIIAKTKEPLQNNKEKNPIKKKTL